MLILILMNDRHPAVIFLYVLFSHIAMQNISYSIQFDPCFWFLSRILVVVLKWFVRLSVVRKFELRVSLGYAVFGNNAHSSWTPRSANANYHVNAKTSWIPQGGHPNPPQTPSSSASLFVETHSSINLLNYKVKRWKKRQIYENLSQNSQKLRYSMLDPR